MSFDELIIKGARQNNLKNIDLALPHDKMIVVTGVSGSGKSSLAFDTVFAEGQWRFIESLSTYARLFLEKLDRPAVDSIINIRPAIALEQRNTVRGSRSTVGTATEVYDYLRLLYSKAAVPYCPNCGTEIKKWAPSGIVKHILETYSGGRAFIIFTSHDPIAELKRKGFHRIMLNGEPLDIEDPQFEDIKIPPPPYEVVLDRLVISDEPRLADSVEGAFKAGHERMKIKLADGPELVFSSGNICDTCGFEMPEPAPILFSFNHPIGACPACKGFGNVLKYSEGLIVTDPYLSVSEGAIEPWQKPAYKWWARQMMKVLKNSNFPVNKPWKDLSKAQKELIFKGQGFYGVNDFFEELEGKRYKLHVRVFLSRYRKGEVCPECRGKRLRPEALAYKLNGYDIAALSAMPVGDLIGFFGNLPLSGEKAQTAKEPLRQIELKLGFLQRVGLGYLSMDRESRTLSGGEYQRVNLSNQLASRLTGTLYVLDEPTVGLHPRDTSRIAEIMRELSVLGNTLLIVEHDKSIIENGDWIVELGPGGGYLGGGVVFSGPKEEFLKTDTVTARYVTGKDRIALPKTTIPRKSPLMEQARCGYQAEIEKEKTLPPGWLGVRGAKGNNLANLNVRFPLGMLTVVSGVSGSGKSSLVVETLYRALARHLRLEPEDPLPYSSLEGVEKIKGVRLIDQSPIGRTPRSNPVTYLKIFDSIRKIYAAQPEAKSHGFGPGFFSFNVPGGRCHACNGEGYQKLEMYFFEDLYIKCETCNGRRYGPEALGVRYKGRDINEVLAMTVEDARIFFSGEHQITARLQQMIDIGLGYLRLGQPATTLSGGEAQRLKICGELGLAPKTGFVYFLDEPTVGLHYRDVAALLLMLRKLVEGGNTVIIIEHNLDVTAAADWVIDLGPEGGKDGGKVIFQGPPGKIVRCKSSYTGKYLKDHLV